MGMLISLATSRIGLPIVVGALVLAGALTWHYVDKAAAVRNAKQALADKVTIETLRAERDEAERRAEVAEQANETLALTAEKASEAARQAEKELEEYEANTTQNNQCVVDQSILDRLRNR